MWSLSCWSDNLQATCQLQEVTRALENRIDAWLRYIQRKLIFQVPSFEYSYLSHSGKINKGPIRVWNRTTESRLRELKFDRQRVWGCDLTIKQKVFWCKFSSFAFPRILCSGCSRKSASVEILWSLGLGWLESQWGAHFGALIKYSKSLGSLSRAPLFALQNDGFYGWTAWNLRNDWSMVQFHKVWVAISFQIIINYTYTSRFQTAQCLPNDPLSLAFSDGAIHFIFFWGGNATRIDYKPGFTKPFGGRTMLINLYAPPSQYHHP